MFPRQLPFARDAFANCTRDRNDVFPFLSRRGPIRVIKRRICSFAPLTPPNPHSRLPAKITKTCYHPPSRVSSILFFFLRPLEFASARAHTSMQMAWALCTVAVNSLTSYSSSKQKGNYFHSDRKVPNEASRVLLFRRLAFRLLLCVAN